MRLGISGCTKMLDNLVCSHKHLLCWKKEKKKGKNEVQKSLEIQRLVFKVMKKRVI